MNRMLYFIALAGLLVPQSGQSAERPNIIYLLADDLGYGDLGCYGQKLAVPRNAVVDDVRIWRKEL